MAARNLRAVAPNEKPRPRPRTKTVTQAASRGTQRELLVALRNRIAKAVEDPSTRSRELASLTKQLVEVVREIDAIDAREEQDAEERGPAEDVAFDASAI